MQESTNAHTHMEKVLFVSFGYLIVHSIEYIYIEPQLIHGYLLFALQPFAHFGSERCEILVVDTMIKAHVDVL